MAINHHDTELRRYLLGELPETQATSLEQEYFGRDDLVDGIRAAESDLVDDYVRGRLSGPARDRFEQHYLATPIHRQRLAIARELLAAQHAAAPVRRSSDAIAWRALAIRSRLDSRQGWAAALAATLLLLVGGAAWMVRTRSIPTPVAVTSPRGTTPSSEAPPSSAPVTPEPLAQGGPGSPRPGPIVVTLALSPLNVRAADDGPILRIPPDAELAVLQLEGDAAAAGVPGDTAVIRTVSGRMVWRGPATVVRAVSRGLVAIEIPAKILPSDDYFVALFETDRDGRETERYRYFLRVRPD